MSRSRADIDAELAKLRGYLPEWRKHLRHEAQFWPQLAALVALILEDADREDVAYIRSRVLDMLAEEGIAPDEGGEVIAWLRYPSDEERNS